MKLPRKSAVASCLLVAGAGPAFAAGITIASPSNNQTVSSPFTLSATASKCSNQTVTSMAWSLDGSANPITSSGSSLSVAVTAPAGAHTLRVVATGSKGATCVANVAVTVIGAPSIPLNAISVSSLQTLSTWQAADDAGTTGTAHGTMSLVTSPAYDGEALEFVTRYTIGGGERYFTVFGDDTTASNFVWDGWVYLTKSVTSIANIEMDMNQVLANGQTVIYGVQCDGYSSTWDYTLNAGTPQNPVDEWMHSAAPCNVSNWTVKKWHHVQIAYARDASGNVTYQSVWLDGVQSQLNATVPSAFALGWGPVLLTNFQVDALGSSGSSTVYLDDLTVYRW
jgi:Bacterial Ig domain